MASSDRWVTRANLLTLLRLLTVPVLVLAIAHEHNTVATGIFFLAVATDFADGWVARRYGEQSPLGGLVDHAVDATFVTAGTAVLAWQGVLPALLPPLISLAFLQYALDSKLAGGRRTGAGGAPTVGRVLRGSPLGRWNGIAYYVIVAVPIVRDSLALGWPGPGLVGLLGWALVASTVVSMADRLRQLRRASGDRTAPDSPGEGTAGRSPR